MDEVMLGISMMRLEFFLETGEYLKDVGGNIRSMGDLIEKASLAGIVAYDESMEALADEIVNVVQACKEQLRELLEYLDGSVEE